MRTRLLAITFIAGIASMPSCDNRPPDFRDGATAFAPCPSTPNCVSSEAADPTHFIEPIRLTVAAAEGWGVVRQVVRDMPRSRIVEDTGGYLRAEVRSRIFRFVDDLELRINESEQLIDVRSASRIGYGDLGVNRKRVETLRAELIRRGVAE